MSAGNDRPEETGCCCCCGSPSESEERTGTCCPVCLKVIEGRLVRSGDDIYMEKECPDHGTFRTVIWRGSPGRDGWIRPFGGTGQSLSASLKTQTKAEHGCPYDCGICPEHRERVCCVLLEVTNRCNQNCPYCFASAGEKDDRDPSLEEIRGWFEYLKGEGEERPFNIHISGGEPTVRDDLPEIIALGRGLGFPYIQLNTNGRRIAEEDGYAEKLAGAGVSVVFLQFDGTDDTIYRALRGRDLFETKKAALEACRRARLPVVLAVTLVPGVNTDDIGNIVRFCTDRLPFVKGVHFQPVSYFGRYPKDAVGDSHRITLPEILREIEIQSGGVFSAGDFVPSGSGHPACSFHGTFLLDGEGRIKPLSPGAACSCGSPYIRSRDYVATKWTLPGEGNQADGWDAFLDEYRSRSFSITAMAFQDAWDLDLRRLSHCYVFILSRDKRLIPFCAYNLTSADGIALYRGREGVNAYISPG